MAICLLFYCCYLLLASAVSAMSGVTPVTYPAKISSQCGKGNPLNDKQLMEALRQTQQQQLPICPQDGNPPTYKSCQEALQCCHSALSGYYQIHAANGSAVQVYCDMEGTNCGGEGGWMRVAYINMTQPNVSCPQGLTQKVLSGLTLCGRLNNSTCQGTVFSALGLNYSRVCGQLRGYQFGSPDAFTPYLQTRATIDGVYVDGVSITYGSAPRKHIWTYATGVDLGHDNSETKVCPCNTNSTNTSIPPYVGSDYYCETGANVYTCCTYHLFHNDTLWDGQQCVAEEAPCCTHPNMPWFLKKLNETTTEDIELRACSDQEIALDNTFLQVIELFIH